LLINTSSGEFVVTKVSSYSLGSITQLCESFALFIDMQSTYVLFAISFLNKKYKFLLFIMTLLTDSF